MDDAFHRSPHTFHIPVMGTGYMIDAPLRVSRYGLSTAISLVDDFLIEQMRRFHCEREGEPYEPIADDEPDARARRITAYLDLLDRLVKAQTEVLRAGPFEPGSQITRYFEMLPESPALDAYRAMQSTPDANERLRQQEQLRQMVVPGSIDVNIMVKGDRDAYRDGEKLPAEFSDASAALRGFAMSTLRSSVVFSAGINPRLYSYASAFDDFYPDEQGRFGKRITLKVSDFHSAEVQGRFLARRGLWVSEFRVESGLNCGGHAFATKGLLLGPILDAFAEQKKALVDQLFATYKKALKRAGRRVPADPPPVRVTVQGGIGTAEEDAMLRRRYHVEGTGWGTPFLLVPEVTNVDEEHLIKLAEATDGSVYLSDSSPFGMPFWNLRNSASERARQEHIDENHPGSRCDRGFVRLFNTEFTTLPICTASRQYQKLKLEQIELADISEEQRAALRQSVLAKSCICHDLAGGATLKNHIDENATPAVCAGPNIVHFSRIAELEEMIGHIYGRNQLMTDPDRPHMFLREVALYIDFLLGKMEKQRLGLCEEPPEYFQEYKDNLLAGIEHYETLRGKLAPETEQRFFEALSALRERVESLEVGAAS